MDLVWSGGNGRKMGYCGWFPDRYTISALSGPLWPELNYNSKQVTLYGLSVPVPGN